MNENKYHEFLARAAILGACDSFDCSHRRPLLAARLGNPVQLLVAPRFHYRREFFSVRARVVPRDLESVAVVVLPPDDPWIRQSAIRRAVRVLGPGMLGRDDDMMPRRPPLRYPDFI